MTTKKQRLRTKTFPCSFTSIFQHKASKTDITNAMDVQMLIPVRAANTPLQGHDIPVAVSRINVSLLSYAALRDRDLVNDLRRFATLHNLRLDLTYPTSYLLHLLVTYQASCKLRVPAAARVKHAIRILETAWKTDIKYLTQNEDFTNEDTTTGEGVWNTNLFQFIHLVLQPLQTRSAYIFFDANGDISRQHDGPGIWRQCQFKSYLLKELTAKWMRDSLYVPGFGAKPW